MHICFDNSSILDRNVYYFEYKGMRFKLIQNNSPKWSDVLVTILPHIDNKNEAQAYNVASEYLSALSWQNKSIVKMWYCGLRGVPDHFRLKNARCNFFYPHLTSLEGCYIGGFGITFIPEIENEEQKNALILFREANSVNNYFLSFHFYWQIIEKGGPKAITWINKTYKKKYDDILYHQEAINHLPLKGKSLGYYFHEDCRNAIAHLIRDSKDKTRISLDDFEDNQRIALSTKIIKEFARFYIKEELKLNKRMHLVRKWGKGFPLYVREEELYKRPFKKMAYRPKRL